MCEIRLTKLPYVAQQVGIVHCYAVAEIKGLSCRLRWMEWSGEICSLQHMWVIGSVMWAAASDESLKFGVQGATATNWFSRVNGARDNGIRLYMLFVLHSQYHDCWCSGMVLTPQSHNIPSSASEVLSKWFCLPKIFLQWIDLDKKTKFLYYYGFLLQRANYTVSLN